jgi:hypothetical protein
MAKRYIFDPDTFDGNCLTVIDTITGNIAYSHLTWDEYNQEHGGNLRALEWKEFNDRWLAPYHLSLQKPWEECTEAKYHYVLGAVPPIQHRDTAGFTTFFCGEATTAHLHQMFANKGNKYWTALRSIHRSNDDLGAELLELVTEVTGRVLSFSGRKLLIKGDKNILFDRDDSDREYSPGETWRISYSMVNGIPNICSAHMVGS